MNETLDGSTTNTRHGKDNNLNLTKYITSFGVFILDNAFLAIFIGAIGYFLGWRFLYTYYGSFGLDASFFHFTPTEVISAGWRSFLLMGVFIIIAAFLYIAGKQLSNYVLIKKGWRFTCRIFNLALLVFLVILFILWDLFYNSWGTYLIKDFFIWSSVLLVILWISYVIGESLFMIEKSEEDNKSANAKYFRIFFPSPFLWLVSVSLGFIILMMFLSSYNAALYARRDKGAGSTLQIASFYVSGELDISDGRFIGNDIWNYDDLRFLTKADDTYFVFRIDEVVNNITTLYAIPADRVVEYRLKSWWAARVSP